MPLSPNKRRKLAAPGTPPPEPASNPFSPLQALGQNHERPSKARTGAAPGQPSTGGKPARDQASNTETEPSSRTADPYSSFSLTKHNHRFRGEDVLELDLDGAERFLLIGSYGIRVLRGEVTVAGAILVPSQNVYWVHAPHCNAVPVLRTKENTSLELHNDPEAESLRRLGKLSPLFRNIWNDTPAEAVEPRPRGPKTFRFLGTSEDAPRGSIIQQLKCHPKWNLKLASVVESASRREPISVFVCGPKSAGKSTFSRILTNRLLTAADEEPTGSAQTPVRGVAVLDLDPGQPEYGPPGTVSLTLVNQPNLGLPFTHASLDDEAYKVVRCHSLASVNPASSTELHLECALDLYDYYRHALRNHPLVINTPGWILSLGLEFLVEVIAKVRPVDVIYMSEDGPAETVEALRDGTTKTFTLLPSQSSDIRSRSAVQSREMQTMSYFHASPAHGCEGSMRLGWSPHALSSVRPVAVPYAGRHRGFLGILRYDSQLPQDLIAEAINGMVLAMVEVERLQAFRGHFQDVASDAMDGAGDTTLLPTVLMSPEGIPVIPNPDDYALDPRHSRTIGLALVRGVDAANRCLQILTPTPLAKINEVKSRGGSIVLVHGRFGAPTWSYTEHLYELADQDEEQEGTAEAGDEDGSGDENYGDEDSGDGGSSTGRNDVSYREDDTAVPWVEALTGNQRRPVGSRVWRVRRDLGRGTGA